MSQIRDVMYGAIFTEEKVAAVDDFVGLGDAASAPTNLSSGAAVRALAGTFSRASDGPAHVYSRRGMYFKDPPPMSAEKRVRCRSGSVVSAAAPVAFS